ncbi:hypothetical protein EV356DRAFT_181625 [Viridothelium virens]|uniref:Fungal N-terminal domain-containing protein n=1 Tax=Viridothelium virens TaxID=1048519 RepID=A0A6A6H8E3_VIRVR|nr:hypothetical protein EV356DRAFT_181625 [Viridothelium virens]
MTDPFSVVVGTVGILSSGVTLCNRLYIYYQDYKSVDIELSRICRQLETTKATITQLQDLLKDSHNDKIKVLTACIDSAQEGIRDLETFWRRTQTGTGSGLILRRNGQKVIFPFQKESLKKLRDTLRSLLSDVGLAIQVLTYDKSAEIASKIETLGQSLANVGKKTPDLDDQRDAATLKDELQDIQLQLLKKPALFQKVCEKSKEGGLEDEDGIAAVRVPEVGSHSQCCTCLQMLQISFDSPYSLKSWGQLEGGPCQCPRHPFADPIICWRFRLPFCTFLLSWTIEINISIGQGSGGTAIPPFLRPIRMVPPDAPAFKAMKRLRLTLLREGETDMGRSYESARSDLLHLFRTRDALPTDINDRGRTLMIELITMVKFAWGSPRSVEHYLDFCRFLMACGVPSNEHDNNGNSAWTIHGDILSALHCFWRPGRAYAKTVGAITVIQFLLDSGIVTPEAVIQVHRWFRNALKNTLISTESPLALLAEHFTAWPDSGESCGNGRLSQAITRQCESECREILYRATASVNDRNELGQTPLHISTIWPAGIAMLLDVGSDPYVFDLMGRSPLIYMCHTFRTRHLSETQVLEAVDLFLDQDIPIPCEDWCCKDADYGVATEKWRAAMARVFHLDPIVAKHLVRALKVRRGRLRTVALEVLPVHTLELLNISSYHVPDINVGAICASLRRFGVMLTRALRGPSLRTTVYHAIASARSSVPSMHLDTVYEFDFRDFDAVDHTGLSPLAGIAIMQPGEWQTIMDQRINDVQHPRSDLDVASWLICKDADMTLSTSDPSLCKPWTVPVNIAHRIGVDLRDLSMTEPMTGHQDLSDSWVALRLVIPRAGHLLDSLGDEGLARVSMLLTLFEKLMTVPIHDTCSCVCSKGGCSAISALLIGYQQGYDLVEFRDTIYETHSPFFHALILGEFVTLIRKFPSLSEQINQSQCLCTAFIRFWTFERLGITHVCCHGNRKSFRQCNGEQHILDPAEIQEIQEEERYTIAQLEELVTEFEMKYEELALNVEDFLEGYWDERMIEVLAVEGPLELVESHKEAAANIGVFLS